ncbi:MAG TPA: nucleotidyltransferase domain-containing protein [Bacteroidales bacterium]|nr:nucleotidyltransferase domain-containing protein [Bacteroidales bacterium]
MIIRDEISKGEEVFRRLCKAHDVKSLYAFGSATNDHFNFQSSDIDLVVEIDEADPVKRGEKLLSLWDAFERFFNRKVDLLTDASIKNPFLRKSIDSGKVLIYDGSGAEIFV